MRRRPNQHWRTLGYGPGRKIKRQKIINKGIIYYPSMKKVKVKKLYKVMGPADMEQMPKNRFLYEPKYDGSRGILMLDKKYGSSFINRREIDVTPSYPELFNSTQRLRASQAVLDGEVVAVGKDKPFGDFKILAEREHVEDGGEILSRSKSKPLKYFAFDILEKDGKDLTSLPLSERKKILDKVIPDNHEDIKEVPFFPNIKELSKYLTGKDAEGIVAKRLDSTYQEDKKSKDWLKKKTLHENDVVLLGYTKGEGKREGKIGALLVGIYNPKSKKYEVKSKVGTGLSDQELDSLTGKLKAITTKENYIKGKVPSAHKFVFVKPKYVARIQFLRETEKGGYREPRYIGLRTDLLPQQTHPAAKLLKNFGAFVTVEKKGKIIKTRTPKEIISLAKELEKELKPYSRRIEVVGSIRRKKIPKDVDFVITPKDKEKIKQVLQSKGVIKAAGDKQIFSTIKGVETDVFFANENDFGAQLMTRTGPIGSNMSNRALAKSKKMRLNQYGLFDRKTGKKIAGRTEKGIYEALGKTYRKPEERGELRR